MLTIGEISRKAALVKWKRLFGPFVRCPECFHGIAKCGLCKGGGKVIQEDIDAWNNPVAKFMQQEVK
ncbi:hypothetical protein ACIQT3_10935 [Enterobacter sichuanensis]|uniref:hypothetical protein n=1 Tax=Enterobacter sichuanensis TaxID=2071710 RepID=UPI00383BDF06